MDQRKSTLLPIKLSLTLLLPRMQLIQVKKPNLVSMAWVMLAMMRNPS